MNLAALLGGIGTTLNSAQAQIDARQKQQMNQLEIARLNLENQHYQQQAQLDTAFAHFDGLGQIAKANPDAGQPPGPYDVTPMGGGGGGGAGGPAGGPGMIPGAQPIAPPGGQQGGGGGMAPGIAGNPLLGPIPPSMMGAGGPGPGGPGGAAPQAKPSPMEQLANMQPPTLDSVAQGIFRQKVQAGANPQDPALARYVQAVAPKAFSQALESYKAQTSQLEAQARIQESLQAHQDHEQDVAASREIAASNRASSNASKGWELFQSKDGTLLRVNKDTGAVAKVDSADAKDLGKVGAPGAPSEGDPHVNDVAKMIANYQMAPLSSQALRSPYGQAVMAKVAQLNPDYNAETYGGRSKAVRDFSTGKEGNAVRSFNVSISHLNTLDNLVGALGNGSVKMLNSAKQKFEQETGGTAPTNFDAAKSIVGDEIIKAIIGGGGALADRENAQNQIDKAESPAQLRGVIKTYKDLMAGQLKGLKKQYEDTTGLKDFDSRLTDETKSQLGGDGGDDGWSIKPVQ